MLTMIKLCIYKMIELYIYKRNADCTFIRAMLNDTFIREMNDWTVHL